MCMPVGLGTWCEVHLWTEGGASGIHLTPQGTPAQYGAKPSSPIPLRRILLCWFLVGLLCIKFQGSGYDSDTYLVRLFNEKDTIFTIVLHFSKYKSK